MILTYEEEQFRDLRKPTEWACFRCGRLFRGKGSLCPFCLGEVFGGG